MSGDYCDRKGVEFFARSAYADLHAAQARFLRHIPNGGAILEGGCGARKRVALS